MCVTIKGKDKYKSYIANEIFFVLMLFLSHFLTGSQLKFKAGKSVERLHEAGEYICSSSLFLFKA